jgi:acyl carrier protein
MTGFMNMHDDTTILTLVREVVAESLSLDVAAVTAEMRLIPDLGASSLDFVDILFLLEERFAIKLQDERFDFASRLGLDADDALRAGVFSPAAVQRLSDWLPSLPVNAEVGPNGLFPFVSIVTLQRIVAERLLAAPQDPQRPAALCAPSS